MMSIRTEHPDRIASRITCMVAVALFLILQCCSSGNGNGDGKKSTGEGPCQEAEECSDGVCLEVNGDSYCSRECGDCPSDMVCDDTLFGALGLSFCVKSPPDSPGQPPAPTEPPRVPCTSDDECRVIDPGLVCATFEGKRDCTISCTDTSQCHFSMSQAGIDISLEFLSCQQDQGDSSRNVCLPDPACEGAAFSNCVTYNINPVSDADSGDIPSDWFPNDTSEDIPSDDSGGYIHPSCEDDLDCMQSPDAYCDPVMKVCFVPCDGNEDCEYWLPGSGTECIAEVCR